MDEGTESLFDGSSLTGLDGPIDKALWLLGEGRLRGWERRKIEEVVSAAAAEVVTLRDHNEEAVEGLARAAWLAQHLLGMIDRETWRASGGDDGQGHYEGEYHADQIAAELKKLAALAVSAGVDPGVHDA